VTISTDPHDQPITLDSDPYAWFAHMRKTEPVWRGTVMDTSMTPPELLLASLGSCAAFYAAAYLKKKGIADAGTRVDVTADKVPNPARVDNFQIEVSVPVELTDEHRAGVEQAVHHCLIHNTLLHPPKIAFTIKEAVGELAAHGV